MLKSGRLARWLDSTDGAIGPLFPDLIEIGMQVFNPLSPTIMAPAEYKAKYGDRLTFYGGIDVERVLPFGTPDEVRAEIAGLSGCWAGVAVISCRARTPC